LVDAKTTTTTVWSPSWQKSCSTFDGAADWRTREKEIEICMNEENNISFQSFWKMFLDTRLQI
jgi:hypothetical protein